MPARAKPAISPGELLPEAKAQIERGGTGPSYRVVRSGRMALTRDQERRFLLALDGLSVGRWSVSLEGGGAAVEFVYLTHPDLVDVNIAATPEWEGVDVLPIDYQFHGEGYDERNHSCDREVQAPWSGNIAADTKLWRQHVLEFIRCASLPGGPLHGVDHGLGVSGGPTEDWEAGAKARRDAIFRHMLGLDENPQTIKARLLAW